jgi:hypothetical protein
MEFDHIVIIVLGLMAALWLLGAAKAGHFILNRRSFASRSAERSMEAFSQKKKFIEVGSWQVAYIDEGSGEPLILLHGCPFHSSEWKDVISLLAPHYRVIAPDFTDPLGDRFGLVAIGVFLAFCSPFIRSCTQMVLPFNLHRCINDSPDNVRQHIQPLLGYLFK